MLCLSFVGSVMAFPLIRVRLFGPAVMVTVSFSKSTVQWFFVIPMPLNSMFGGLALSERPSTVVPGLNSYSKVSASRGSSLRFRKCGPLHSASRNTPPSARLCIPWISAWRAARAAASSSSSFIRRSNSAFILAAASACSSKAEAKLSMDSSVPLPPNSAFNRLISFSSLILSSSIAFFISATGSAVTFLETLIFTCLILSAKRRVDKDSSWQMLAGLSAAIITTFPLVMDP
mmetsp:Transcript_48790/g.86893  ORF Transcript_48790/g.86893 Transcript_48790/m.86893 type:complete len:232 (+) Transcript_48790:1487-2182(+)